jgi:flagella basal body P-ring formation protein FlgA
VEVRVENGALRVTVQGRVLEDGRMGQQVLVRNTSSQRELFAEVVGRDAVLFRP